MHRYDDVADYLGKEIRRLGCRRRRFTEVEPARKWIDIPICYNRSLMIIVSRHLNRPVFRNSNDNRRVPRIGQGDQEETARQAVCGLRSRLGRRQHLAALVPVDARRQSRRQDDKVVLNSPETAKRWKFCEGLYET